MSSPSFILQPLTNLEDVITNWASTIVDSMSPLQAGALAIAGAWILIWVMYKGYSIMVGASQDSVTTVLFEGIKKGLWIAAGTGALIGGMALKDSLPKMQDDLTRAFTNNYNTESLWSDVEAAFGSQIGELMRLFKFENAGEITEMIDSLEGDSKVKDSINKPLKNGTLVDNVCTGTFYNSFRSELSGLARKYPQGQPRNEEQYAKDVQEATKQLVQHINGAMDFRFGKVDSPDNTVSAQERELFTKQCVQKAVAKSYEEMQSDGALDKLKGFAGDLLASLTFGASGEGVLSKIQELASFMKFDFAGFMFNLPAVGGRVVAIIGMWGLAMPLFFVLMTNKIYLLVMIGVAPLIITARAFSPTSGWFNTLVNNMMTSIVAYAVIFLMTKMTLDLLVKLNSQLNEQPSVWLVLAGGIAFWVICKTMAAIILKAGDVVGTLFAGAHFADNAGQAAHGATMSGIGKAWGMTTWLAGGAMGAGLGILKSVGGAALNLGTSAVSYYAGRAAMTKGMEKAAQAGAQQVIQKGAQQGAQQAGKMSAKQAAKILGKEGAEQLAKKGGARLALTGAKWVARGALRFVPFVGWGLLAYDAYQLASWGYNKYKESQNDGSGGNNPQNNSNAMASNMGSWGAGDQTQSSRSGGGDLGKGG